MARPVAALPLKVHDPVDLLLDLSEDTVRLRLRDRPIAHLRVQLRLDRAQKRCRKVLHAHAVRLGLLAQTLAGPDRLRDVRRLFSEHPRRRPDYESRSLTDCPAIA